MQLFTSATKIDYYPVGTGKRFVKKVVWHPGSESEMIFFATKLKTEMKYEVENYIANGAVVTNINTEEYTGSDYSPLACWEASRTVCNPIQLIIMSISLDKHEIRYLIDAMWNLDPIASKDLAQRHDIDDAALERHLQTYLGINKQWKDSIHLKNKAHGILRKKS